MALTESTANWFKQIPAAFTPVQPFPFELPRRTEFARARSWLCVLDTDGRHGALLRLHVSRHDVTVPVGWLPSEDQAHVPIAALSGLPEAERDLAVQMLALAPWNEPAGAIALHDAGRWNTLVPWLIDRGRLFLDPVALAMPGLRRLSARDTFTPVPEWHLRLEDDSFFLEVGCFRHGITVPCGDMHAYIDSVYGTVGQLTGGWSSGMLAHLICLCELRREELGEFAQRWRATPYAALFAPPNQESALKVRGRRLVDCTSADLTPAAPANLAQLHQASFDEAMAQYRAARQSAPAAAGLSGGPPPIPTALALPLTRVGLDSVVDWRVHGRKAYRDYGSDALVFAPSAAAAKRALVPDAWLRRLHYTEFDLVRKPELERFAGEDVEPNGLITWAVDHRTRCPVCGRSIWRPGLGGPAEQRLPADGERITGLRGWQPASSAHEPLTAIAAADALVCEPCFPQYEPRMRAARARIDAFKATRATIEAARAKPGEVLQRCGVKPPNRWLLCEGEALEFNTVRQGADGQLLAVLWDGDWRAFTTPLDALEAAARAGHLRSRTVIRAAAKEIAGAQQEEHAPQRKVPYPTGDLREVQQRSHWLIELPRVRPLLSTWRAIANFMAEQGEEEYARALRRNAEICSRAGSPQDARYAAVFCAYHLTAPRGALTADLLRHTRKPRNELALEVFYDDWDYSDLILSELHQQGRAYAAADRAWLRSHFGRTSRPDR